MLQLGWFGNTSRTNYVMASVMCTLVCRLELCSSNTCWYFNFGQQAKKFTVLISKVSSHGFTMLKSRSSVSSFLRLSCGSNPSTAASIRDQNDAPRFRPPCQFATESPLLLYRISGPSFPGLLVCICHSWHETSTHLGTDKLYCICHYTALTDKLRGT